MKRRDFNKLLLGSIAMAAAPTLAFSGDQQEAALNNFVNNFNPDALSFNYNISRGAKIFGIPLPSKKGEAELSIKPNRSVLNLNIPGFPMIIEKFMIGDQAYVYEALGENNRLYAQNSDSWELLRAYKQTGNCIEPLNETFSTTEPDFFTAMYNGLRNPTRERLTLFMRSKNHTLNYRYEQNSRNPRVIIEKDDGSLRKLVADGRLKDGFFIPHYIELRGQTLGGFIGYDAKISLDI